MDVGRKVNRRLPPGHGSGGLFGGFSMSAYVVFTHIRTRDPESPDELISSFRLERGEARVVRDATLDRIAPEQASHGGEGLSQL
jgi:hypothetical protein